MKLEKISDKQIRCTLTGDDLSSRQLKLSELAYGSEKAKELFQDLMQQARKDLGFESGNSPIMVEAIPMAPDSLVLIITKVDDPEELDTRFSRFSAPGEEEAPAAPEKHFAGADEILDLFRKICDAKDAVEEEKAADSKEAGPRSDTDTPDKKQEEKPLNLIQLFQFSSLDGVIAGAHGLNNSFDEKNSLYKDSLTGDYLLVLHQNSCSPENFNKVSNILSEYSQVCMFHASGVAFLDEHMDCIIRDTAVQTLSQL